MNQGGAGDIIASILPLVILFGIFYFLIIRPQQQQQKKHQAMVAALAKGDKVITNGGLHAEVIKVEEEFLSVKLNDDTIVKLAKDYVAKKLD